MFRLIPLLLAGCAPELSEPPQQLDAQQALARCEHPDTSDCLDQVISGAQDQLDWCALDAGADPRVVEANRFDNEHTQPPQTHAEREHLLRSDTLLEIRDDAGREGCRGWIPEEAVLTAAESGFALADCSTF